MTHLQAAYGADLLWERREFIFLQVQIEQRAEELKRRGRQRREAVAGQVQPLERCEGAQFVRESGDEVAREREHLEGGQQWAGGWRAWM